MCCRCLNLGKTPTNFYAKLLILLTIIYNTLFVGVVGVQKTNYQAAVETDIIYISIYCKFTFLAWLIVFQAPTTPTHRQLCNLLILNNKKLSAYFLRTDSLLPSCLNTRCKFLILFIFSICRLSVRPTPTK